MVPYLIIVARDRPDLFQQLSERHGAAIRVVFDRREDPRAIVGTSTLFTKELEHHGFTVVHTAWPDSTVHRPPPGSVDGNENLYAQEHPSRVCAASGA